MFQALSRIRLVLAKAKPQGDAAYRVFTQDNDVEVEASQLSFVLGPLPNDQLESHDQAWVAFSGALQRWRTDIHIYALDSSTKIRRAKDAAQIADTAVTILVDQSGSMRGQSMLLAAASCDVAQDFLCHLGISVEILGFTTVRWRGGKSRERWLRQGRPRHPGRLCDLLHIIYRRADDNRAATSASTLKPMLRPDLPKENVDGEALLWAVSRLRSSQKTRKFLVVISDGAPVDDATLAANDLGYLDRHLREVIQSVGKDGDVQILGIGIGFDLSRYYSTCSCVTTPEQLGITLISALEAAITA